MAPGRMDAGPGRGGGDRGRAEDRRGRPVEQAGDLVAHPQLPEAAKRLAEDRFERHGRALARLVDQAHERPDEASDVVRLVEVRREAKPSLQERGARGKVVEPGDGGQDPGEDVGGERLAEPEADLQRRPDDPGVLDLGPVALGLQLEQAAHPLGEFAAVGQVDDAGELLDDVVGELAMPVAVRVDPLVGFEDRRVLAEPVNLVPLDAVEHLQRPDHLGRQGLRRRLGLDHAADAEGEGAGNPRGDGVLAVKAGQPRFQELVRHRRDAEAGQPAGEHQVGDRPRIPPAEGVMADPPHGGPVERLELIADQPRAVARPGDAVAEEAGEVERPVEPLLVQPLEHPIPGPSQHQGVTPCESGQGRPAEPGDPRRDEALVGFPDVLEPAQPIPHARRRTIARGPDQRRGQPTEQQSRWPVHLQDAVDRREVRLVRRGTRRPRFGPGPLSHPRGFGFGLLPEGVAPADRGVARPAEGAVEGGHLAPERAAGRGRRAGRPSARNRASTAPSRRASAPGLDGGQGVGAVLAEEPLPPGVVRFGGLRGRVPFVPNLPAILAPAPGAGGRRRLGGPAVVTASERLEVKSSRLDPDIQRLMLAVEHVFDPLVERAKRVVGQALGDELAVVAPAQPRYPGRVGASSPATASRRSGGCNRAPSGRNRFARRR